MIKLLAKTKFNTIGALTSRTLIGLCIIHKNLFQ